MPAPRLGLTLPSLHAAVCSATEWAGVLWAAFGAQLFRRGEALLAQRKQRTLSAGSACVHIVKKWMRAAGVRCPRRCIAALSIVS